MPAFLISKFFYQFFDSKAVLGFVDATSDYPECGLTQEQIDLFVLQILHGLMQGIFDAS